ncbi:MAG: hypothetical protein K6A77_11515 [Clostridiales bacterium]|nr:hypothetical protein [Clostridiales bacterium]
MDKKELMEINENDSRKIVWKEDTAENRKKAAESWEKTVKHAKEIREKYNIK